MSRVTVTKPKPSIFAVGDYVQSYDMDDVGIVFEAEDKVLRVVWTDGSTSLLHSLDALTAFKGTIEVE